MHEGHRQRMYEKLMQSDSIYDHEVLEILLFNAYPRMNTNPIAHKLLDTFGTLNDIFRADVNELIGVEGVGRNVALYIKLVGLCMSKIDRDVTGITYLKSYADFKNFITLRLRAKSSEVLEFYLLEKSGKVKNIYTYSDKDPGQVGIKSEELVRILSANQPYGLLVAHNHLSGNCAPSDADDRFTMELQVICSVNNVRLYDHCIFAGDNNIYSYFSAGKIDEIKQRFSFKNLVDTEYKSGFKKDKDKK